MKKFLNILIVVLLCFSLYTPSFASTAKVGKHLTSHLKTTTTKTAHITKIDKKIKKPAVKRKKVKKPNYILNPID